MNKPPFVMSKYARREDLLRSAEAIMECCERCTRIDKEIAEIEAKKASAGSACYAHSEVVMEGLLELERLNHTRPINCNCDGGLPRPTFLTGWVKRDDGGATALHHLESVLELLNGRRVKVTVEWA